MCCLVVVVVVVFFLFGPIPQHNLSDLRAEVQESPRLNERWPLELIDVTPDLASNETHSLSFSGLYRQLTIRESEREI